jgi:hypothetical protein
MSYLVATMKKMKAENLHGVFMHDFRLTKNHANEQIDVSKSADNFDLEYHELCHQLHGSKSEFDGADDGECHVAGWSDEQKRWFTVKSALYRGIFWQTLNKLQ